MNARQYDDFAFKINVYLNLYVVQMFKIRAPLNMKLWKNNMTW